MTFDVLSKKTVNIIRALTKTILAVKSEVLKGKGKFYFTTVFKNDFFTSAIILLKIFSMIPLDPVVN